MTDSSSLSLAIAQIQFARSYTLTLLDDLSDEDWFQVVPGSPSHLAWQIGHLAMAQYGLCLFRIRGRQPVDTELMSGPFRKAFSKGTTPDPAVSARFTMTEIRNVLDRVHEQAMLELPQLSPELLADPVEAPYAAFPNKLGSLLFCSHHEMLHAGQIGLLRRLLGKSPVR